MSNKNHLCYACGSDVPADQNSDQMKCASCDTLLKKVEGIEYLIPVGMELPENFNKAKLDDIVRLTNPEQEAKRFRKRQGVVDEVSIDEISNRLTSSLQDLVRATVHAELTGQPLGSPLSSVESLEEVSKKEVKGLKQGNKSFKANRVINHTDEGEVVEPLEHLDTEVQVAGEKMMNPEERQEFIQAHREAGNEAKAISRHGSKKGAKISGMMMVTVCLGLIAFFMVIAYGTIMLSKDWLKEDAQNSSLAENEVEKEESEAEVSVPEKTSTENRAAESEFDITEAKKVVINFLNSRNRKYAVDYILPFKNQNSVFNQYWQIRGLVQKDEISGGEVKTSPSGVPYAMFKVSSKEGEREVFVCKLEENDYRIDWKSYMGVEEGTLKEFLNAGAQSKMTLRTKLIVSNNYTAFYNRKDWISLTAEDPHGATTSFYMPRNSSMEKTFFRMVKDPYSLNEENKTARCVYTVLSGAGTRPVIIDVISTYIE